MVKAWDNSFGNAKLFLGLEGAAAVYLWPVLRRLPNLSGRRVAVSFTPDLTAHRGALLSGQPKGEPVYAGSFLRERRIVMDSELLRSPGELARIFVHEIGHFVWTRAGNQARASYEDLLNCEFLRHARGELGWSAESRKSCLEPPDREERSQRWREYVCESFCDTAAWMLSGLHRHTEFTLAPQHRRRRRDWLTEFLNSRTISI